jgi:penicillin-binding protein 2
MSNGAFNNFAIQGQYTPGSTFKMISATAMLQTGIQSASKVINDKGTYKVPGCLQGYHGCVFHGDEAAGSGYVNLARALTVSSDVYFYQLGYLFWSQTGRYGLTPIQNVASEFGLDSPTQIDLPNENVGRVDSPTVRKALHAEAPKAFPNVDWFTGDNLQMAFGQGSTAVTPLEMANAFATFANGGTRYAPEVVSAVVDARGKVIQSYGPKVLGHVNLPERIRGPILQGLLGVVSSPDGTAYSPFARYAHFSLRDFPIAGKTGTASNSPGQEPNAWFVAFGPVPHPKYVVLCVIGKGGYGASSAAPVVAQAFDYLVKHPVKPIRIAPAIKTTNR